MKLRALALALLVGSLLGAPAHAAIAVTVPASSSIQGGISTTLVRNGLTIPANALGIVGGIVRKSVSGDTYGISDGTNSYTIVECDPVGGSANKMFIAYFRYGGTGLTAGSITLTSSVAHTAATFQVIYATGIKTPSPEDAAVYNAAGTPSCNTQTSTSPSITSGTPSAAGDLLINMIGKPSTSTSFSDTEDTGNGWTGNYGTGNTNVVAVMAYQVNAGSGTKVHNPTMNSAAWYQMIVGFFEDVAPATQTTSRMGLLGVGR